MSAPRSAAGSASESAAALVDLVLPRRCVGCRASAGPLCHDCFPTAEPFVALDVAGVPVIAAGVYDGGLRRAVIAYKERGRRDLARLLARLLGAALRPLLDAAPGRRRPVLVTPPVSRTVAARRGGDHVLRLARGAPGATALPGTLQRVRTVRDSAGLSVAARERNLAGAFRARPPPRPGALAVVVDDIVTTGATVGEAARALGAAGWVVTGAAVVCATPRRFFANPLAAPGERV